MRKLPSKPAVTAWARLLRAQTQLLDEVGGALKAADLPPLIWYDVLLEVHRARSKGLRQQEIGNRTLLPKYNLSRLIDRLEREGLVERIPCPEDARANIVRSTQAGRALLKRMWPVYGSTIYAQFEAKLTAAEVTTLAKILDKLTSRIPPDSGGDG